MRISRWAAVVSATVIGAAPLLLTGLSAAAAASVHSAPPPVHHAVRGDFDGDGKPDLAVGAPGVSVKPGGDRVRVIYSRAKVAGSHAVWLDDPTTGGFHPYFGSALATGDFNSDGFADLAVGAPGYYGPDSQDGAIYIFLGSHSGLHYTGSSFTGPDDFDNDNELGAALAAGDLNGDGYSDLLAGNPGPGGGGDEQGSVMYFSGSVTGLVAGGGAYTSSAPVIEGRFGAAVAIGDVNGDGYKDVIVGEPGGGKPTPATFGAGSGAGDVQVIYGTSNGPGTHRSTIYARSVGAKGHLGASLAAGDINHDGYADIAAGAPAATVNGKLNAGRAVVFYGGKHGIAAARSKTISRQSPGVPGLASKNDDFGSSVALGDLTGDHHANLIVGIPGALVAGKKGAGAVDVFHVSGAGVATAHARQVTAATHGIPSDPTTGASFGYAVSTRGPAVGQRSLLVGIPFKHAGGRMIRIPGGPNLLRITHVQVISDPQPFDRLGQAFPA